MEFSFSEHIILENAAVLLRPLEKEDFKELSGISYDYEIWRFNVSRCMNNDELISHINSILEEKRRERIYPFIIIDKKKQLTAGSSSFSNISNRDKRLEIGGSWLGRNFQGTGLNINAKYLMINYAFETLGFERVEFKTDVLNLQARKSLKKIGAVEEGVLRSHTLMQDGRRRDTIYYSILHSEWEKIKNTVFNYLV